MLVRSEYPAALARMREAVGQAYACGHLGLSVHGTTTSVDIQVVDGAGSYVAGEETALIASLEGGRGCARPRPPYPTEHGLWDAPTVVNNAEPVSLSERFARPGCYEVELGTSVQRIVTELGGGLKDGAELVALQIGGPLGGFLAADSLDVLLSEAELSAWGAALGHAGLVAFDERVTPEEVLHHVWEFAAAESCGACSPCRVGSRRGLDMASAGTPPGQEWERLSRLLAEASLCAFGRRIPPAVHSLARAYGDRLAGWGP